MYRTIVVGCDGSEHEIDAIALAQQLRDPQHGRLILVNSYPLYSGRAEESNASLRRSEANVAYGVPCELLDVPASTPEAALNDIAETSGADLIVLGGSHHGLVSDRPVRRTARRLLHGAPCAVAVAAPGQLGRFGASPTIGVAYDASPESEAALNAAFDVALAAGARILLLLALEPVVLAAGLGAGAIMEADEPRRDHAQERLAAAETRAPDGVVVEGHVLLGAAADTIAAAAADVDLLVTGSRGFGVMHRVLVGSTSAALLRDGRTPMLITPRVLIETSPFAHDAVVPAGATR